MPLIVIVGLPSSGKSNVSLQIKNYLAGARGIKVHLVSDNDILNSKKLNKNVLYGDSQKEKELRGTLKSEALRNLETDSVVILDASNYIKGYRYELYCAAKNNKSTQVTVECLVPKDTCWDWNANRTDEEKYTRETFEALHLRYEAPDNRNRWDSPLICFRHEEELKLDDIYDSLFSRKPPPPNQSTQSTPVTSACFLYELDKITQAVVTAVISSQKLGLASVTKLSLDGYGACDLDDNLILGGLTPVQLNKLRRQFLNYTKLHPPSSSKDENPKRVAQLFVQFLQKSISGV